MPRPLSAEEYQELGRRYYKLKQFDKALETFNDAIDASPTVSLHDHRAACYDKLGDYDAAVRDGRAMIKLDKQDVRGYLRTTSVLDKSGKPEIALSIYKYGMRHVRVEDKSFKVRLRRCEDVRWLERLTHMCCSCSNSSTISLLASSRPPKPLIRSPCCPSKSPR